MIAHPFGSQHGHASCRTPVLQSTTPPPHHVWHCPAPCPCAGGSKGQIINGIVLTKFDTIDDKVGAALSMVYASGAPVMFVGCGQTYVDLKKLNVRSVVKSLLK